jgi:hypothetical protein
MFLRADERLRAKQPGRRGTEAGEFEPRSAGQGVHFYQSNQPF